MFDYRCGDCARVRAGREERCKLHGSTKPPTAAWIRLDKLFPAGPGDPQCVIPDGLILTGDVPGWLQRWERSADGTWYGVVNFSIRYIARVDQYSAVRQIVPAAALRRRDD